MHLPRFAMTRRRAVLVALVVLALGALAAAWPLYSLYSLYSSGGLYSWWDEREFSWEDREFSTPHAHYLRAARCQSNKTIISLGRRPGFGPGPEYDLTICGDGSVVYEGHGGVRVKGVRQTKIRPAEVQELVGAFEDIDYFKLEDYRACSTDQSTTYTSLTLGTRRKSVVDLWRHRSTETEEGRGEDRRSRQTLRLHRRSSSTRGSRERIGA